MNRIYGIFTKSREKAQEHVKELLKQAWKDVFGVDEVEFV